MKIERICIIAKLEDGTIRQVVITKAQQRFVLDAIRATDPNNSVKILESQLEGIEFIN